LVPLMKINLIHITRRYISDGNQCGETMTTLQILITILASINLLMSLTILFRIKQPASPVLWIIKAVPTALSPILALVGLLIVISGVTLYSPVIILLAGGSTLIYFTHIVLVTRSPDPTTGFEQAFGLSWTGDISNTQRAYFLPRRTVLRLPSAPEPLFEQDIVFYTVPETNRPLLCDLWQPPKNRPRSGLAFIYLHGSAWYVLDKDTGTRTFFRHLAAQGHVIMDVAYRLFPETDMMGMVHDAKHAIAWMKSHSSRYNVDPSRIVLGGGSSGGHLSLLAAFTANQEQFIPTDLIGVDLSLRGVISAYGPTDLEALYYHTGQHITTRTIKSKSKAPPSSGPPAWIRKIMGRSYFRLGFDKMHSADQELQPGTLPPMLAGHPDEKPEVYALFSPITHVHPDCPPIFIIQGEHDLITSAKATRIFFGTLKEAKVPAVMHIVPQVDHAFDLFLPKLSPSAHVAYYDIERFLGVMACQVRSECGGSQEPSSRPAKTEMNGSGVATEWLPEKAR
jgi:acetyl esterase/lipase